MKSYPYKFQVHRFLAYTLCLHNLFSENNIESDAIDDFELDEEYESDDDGENPSARVLNRSRDDIPERIWIAFISTTN